jgi:superfamily II DNA/RNA helicase
MGAAPAPASASAAAASRCPPRLQRAARLAHATLGARRAAPRSDASWRARAEADDAAAASSSGADAAAAAATRPDLNQLQTALHAAVAAEDWAAAASARDALAAAVGADAGAGRGAPADWAALGLPPWLADRAEALGFPLPTEVQRRAAPVLAGGADAVIESETGSGKTLAFLLPALALLQYPPDTYPDDLLGPQLLIVVPTRELGVQVAMLVFRLFGGSVNPGLAPGERSNMFRFAGPRGLRVRGLLVPEEAAAAAAERGLRGAHVVVGTPELIEVALKAGVEVAHHARVVVVDEADACLGGAHGAGAGLAIDIALAGAALDDRARPTVALVGATLGDALVDEAIERGRLRPDAVRVAVGTRMRPPPALRHRAVAVPAAEGARGRVGALARLLRADAAAGGPDAPPPRVIVFAADDAAARELARPLRAMLWGDHSMAVLLGEGVEPITALHAFRDARASLLVATPAAARGLDLPAVSHVYNAAPPSGAAEYLHRAGRAGRIGAGPTGVVTTLTSGAEEAAALDALAAELGVALERVEPPAPAALARAVAADDAGAAGGGDEDAPALDMEAARRALEDVLELSGPGHSEEEG